MSDDGRRDESRRTDGVGRLLGWRDEQRGVPPAVGRVRAHLDEVAPGTTTVRLPLHPELLLPGGVPSAGVASLVADIGLTTSVVASLPHALAVTTVSMTVDHVGPVPDAGTLVAVCRSAAYADGRPQHASGDVRDGTGRLVAVVSGWFLPAVVQATGAERERLAQEAPAQDLHALLGLVPAGAGFGLVAREALGNATGTLHGGIGALACDVAAQDVLGPDARLLTSAFTYLRPTPRGGVVDVAAQVLRRGRRTGTATCTVVGADGRLALQATVVGALGAAADEPAPTRPAPARAQEP
jgi:acyl-coenzyme A thioesterase PaaI-like protein